MVKAERLKYSFLFTANTRLKASQGGKKMEEKIEDLVREAEPSVIVEETQKKLLYEGNSEIKLPDYLDIDPSYHNWSRACDVGH